MNEEWGLASYGDVVAEQAVGHAEWRGALAGARAAVVVELSLAVERGDAHELRLSRRQRHRHGDFSLVEHGAIDLCVAQQQAHGADASRGVVGDEERLSRVTSFLIIATQRHGIRFQIAQQRVGYHSLRYFLYYLRVIL